MSKKYWQSKLRFKPHNLFSHMALVLLFVLILMAQRWQHCDVVHAKPSTDFLFT